MKLSDIPWQIWMFLGVQLITFLITWGRTLLRVTNLEKHNNKQDEKLEKILVTANSTNIMVAKINGYIEAKKEIKNG